MFKNGNLKDHLERTKLERTDIKEDDSLTVTFVFKPDTTIAVASPVIGHCDSISSMCTFDAHQRRSSAAR